MKSCPHCSSDNEETAILCRKCGAAEMVCPVPSEPLEGGPAVEPSSQDVATSNGNSAEFIRVFFKSSKQERLAVHCAGLIANVVGERIGDLRPDTRWSEIFEWARPSPTHTVAFTFALKKEFGPAAQAVIDDPECMTFREFVEYVSTPGASAA